MKYCTNCGKPIEITDKFCVNCGCSLEPSGPVPPREEPASDASEQSSFATEKEGDARNCSERKTGGHLSFGNRTIILASIAALVVLVVAFVFMAHIWSREANEKTISLPNGGNLVLRVVPNGLWFGKYEVTQAQWEAVMGENPSRFKGADNPVERVSWDDCQVFLKKLHSLPSVKKSELTFRLPTDEEWEYACRADATGAYCKLDNGTEISELTLGEVAWFADNSDKTTHPVGQKKPNAFGLYDTNGNVWEWTQTAAGVTCGGGWRDAACFCESSRRARFSPSFRDCRLGFRLCASGRANNPPASKLEANRAERGGEDSPSTTSTSTIETIFANMVQIPGKNYKMSKYEVTQAQWEAVMGKNPSQFKGENNPVENVSWNDCQVFLEKLNALPDIKKSGLTFRLPTEEEWEFACRAGTTGDYCKLANGKKITESTLGKVAWFEDNSDETTHPVGRKEPNVFGLYDMHGNVWEWTQTKDGEDLFRSGGGWDCSAGDCESSYRDWTSPDHQDASLGFRLCASERTN